LYVDEYPRDTDVNSFEAFRPVEIKPRVLEDWELESRASRRNSRFSLTSSLKRKLGSMAGSMTSSKQQALLEEGILGGEDGKSRDKKKKKEVKEKERL